VAHDTAVGLLAVSRGPREDRGASVPGAGAAVASRISASTIGEVGWGRRLGQHGETRNSFEAHRRG
jgi:hypothetical protein